MRRASLAARAAILALSLGGSMALAELLLGVLGPPSSDRIHFAARSKTCCDFDPRLIWRLRPGLDVTWRHADYVEHTSTNSLGLRGTELSRPRRGPRILAAGDSFTYGVGVDNDEAYPAVLQSMLEGAGVEAEVVNAGHPGYSFDQTYRSVLERWLELRPDLVIAGVHCTDIAWDWEQSLYSLTEGELVPLDAGRTWIGLQLRARDAVPGWLRRLRSFRAILAALERRDPFAQLPALGPEERAPWQREKILLQMQSLSDVGKARGFGLLAVLMPCKEDLGKEAPSTYGDLAARLEDRGISTLVGAAALPPDPREHFFGEDIHLRASGNRLLAAAVARAVEARGLLGGFGPPEGERAGSPRAGEASRPAR